ncbi:hypothetical protein NQ317_014382 [Molorchus minor]|uniref:NADPH:adrenodoxin oxidoreductase, mitochondrial n=1 Tax=Molorchus minor TaxID=1323400 RepID=A0ABQ9K544_9CUCU|nr:hypothetical protein NQ317_014382 [Molorchus minor]
MRAKAHFSILKRFYSVRQAKVKICIVGGGPAGFYAAQHLVKKLDSSQIDIYERLPVPFGLVRFGVAPDHPEVKNVINTFTKNCETSKCPIYRQRKLRNRCFSGAVKNGLPYSTYGAEHSRKLNIPGEDIPNVIEARRIVGWYNGIPWDSNLKIDLSGDTVAIFGQGNVAIDVARILLTPVDLLKSTDITQHALEALTDSNIKKVYLIGRRGPLQAAFTIKELREMLKLQSCKTIWKPQDFSGVAEVVPTLARPKKRIAELMLKSVGENSDTSTGNEFRPIFFKSPLEINGKNKVQSVTLGTNELIGDDILSKKAVLTEAKEVLDCNLVVPSIGYKPLQADENIPFDPEKGVAKNVNGKITAGLYTSGWLSTGPSGVILTTMNHAFAVADLILNDINVAGFVNEEKEAYEEINRILREKNVQVIGWADWEKIDRFEQEEGKKVGKPREKLVDVKKMLEIAE